MADDRFDADFRATLEQYARRAPTTVDPAALAQRIADVPRPVTVLRGPGGLPRVRVLFAIAATVVLAGGAIAAAGALMQAPPALQGSSLVYGAATGGLWVQEPGDPAPRLVLPGGIHPRPVWSDDGRYIATLSAAPDDDPSAPDRLIVLEPDGTVRVDIEVSGLVRDLRWGADAETAHKLVVANRESVLVADADTGLVATSEPLGEEGPCAAAWVPGTSQVTWLSGRSTFTSVEDVRLHRREVVATATSLRIGPDSSVPVSLDNGRRYQGLCSMQVTPDGGAAVVAARVAQNLSSEPILVPMRGGSAISLSTRIGAYDRIFLDREGTRLLTSSGLPQESRPLVVPLDGSRASVVDDLPVTAEDAGRWAVLDAGWWSMLGPVLVGGPSEDQSWGGSWEPHRLWVIVPATGRAELVDQVPDVVGADLRAP